MILVSGCSEIGALTLDQQFGEAVPRDTVVQTLASRSIDYWSEVKPVIESRCISCLGCYDAPSQSNYLYCRQRMQPAKKQAFLIKLTNLSSSCISY